MPLFGRGKLGFLSQLLDLLIRPPIVLPKRPDLLSQPVTKILHPDPDSLHLCAWMLSNLTSEQLAYQRTLLPWQPRADALQPEEHMTIAYNITANGATRKASVPILYLYRRLGIFFFTYLIQVSTLQSFVATDLQLA